jgi:signal transduction histidine kinase/CheY-like chemotaxis protein
VLKEWFDKSLRLKLLGLGLIIVLVSALTSALIISRNELGQWDGFLYDKAHSLASYVADISKDDILSGDNLHLDNIVKKINNDPDIICAVIYDNQGKLLTSLFAGVNLKIPEVKQIVSQASVNTSFADILTHIHQHVLNCEVSVPVIMGHESLGRVVIMLSTDKARQGIGRTINGIILGGIFSLLIAFFLLWWFLGVSIKPVLELVRLMDHVSQDKDYTLRAQIHAGDELGLLAGGFNNMLEQIQNHHEASESKNKELDILNNKLQVMYDVQKEFTSTVSHELRTPLASIKSSIDILNTEVPGKLTEDQKVFIRRVKSNIDRLSRLINDVLDLSKLESGRMTINLLPLSPEAVVGEVVEMHKAVVEEKGLIIEVELDKDLPVFMADKDRLIQVLNNLINNALKFTRQGKIVISVHCEDKRNMTFCVRDTGIGIKDEDLPKLFRKFQQVGDFHGQVGGTGLGLAICKQIIEKHNGHMWVESQFNKGSTFCFNIPIRKEKRILIVDDDQGTLTVLRNILETHDSYEIETVCDGFHAGQKYHSFSPDLIILDVQIPKINGLEVCRRIKNDPSTQNTRIIMLSNFDTDLKKKEAWDAGADEILCKPVNPEELIAKVRKFI